MSFEKEPCSHLVIMMGKITGSLSDEDFRVYHCIKCGFPVLAAPVMKFKHNAAAKKIFAKIAEEINDELPKLDSFQKPV